MRDGDKPASQIVKDLDQIVIWIKIVKDLDSVQKQQDELLARMGAALDWLSKKIGRPGASDFSYASCERDSAIGVASAEASFARQTLDLAPDGPRAG